MYNILLCDDEKDIVSAMKIYLANEEYSFFEAFTGREAVEIVQKNRIDLVIMDIMMPELDGLNALDRIRRISNVPVIFLTAKSEDSDKIIGLNFGADDYITKPFNPVELIARVKSHLRRYVTLGGVPKKENTLGVDGIELFRDSRTVTVDGEEVSLTPKEYDILELLIQNIGVSFTPDEIYSRVWGTIPYGVDNTIAVHIRHIREKIEADPAHPRHIKVEWGRGYKFERSVKR